MSEREATAESAADGERLVDAESSGGQTLFQSLLLAALCLASGAVAGRISTLLSTVVIGMGINLISQVVAQVNFSRAQHRKRLVDGVASLEAGVGTPVEEAVVKPARILRSRPRQLIVILLIGMTLFGLLLGRASESSGFGLITTSPTVTTTTGGNGTTSLPGSGSTTSSTATSAVEPDLIEVIVPETLKVGHQNELFTKVPPGAQTEYVFQGQRYPAVVKDFWIRPDEPGTYALQVIVTDNEGGMLFDETFEFDAVQGPISERTCNRFLRTEISDIVGLDILLDSSFSSLGLNSCIWQVPNQPTQALAMAIHEGVSSDAMVAWLETTTASAVQVDGAERGWTLADDGGVRVLAVDGRSFVDVTIGEPLPVGDPTAVAADVAAFGLERVASGESPSAVACQFFTADEVSLLAQTQLTQQEPAVPTSCRYAGADAQVDVQVNEGNADLDSIAAAVGLESPASTEEQIAGRPALVLTVDGGFGTVIGLNTDSGSLVVSVVKVLGTDESQKSSEDIARELMLAALERS